MLTPLPNGRSLEAIKPLGSTERAIVARVVDVAPPINPGTATELRALLAPQDPVVAGLRRVLHGNAS